ncbi:hypothetical protein [Streptomyces sp. NPDC005805]
MRSSPCAMQRAQTSSTSSIAGWTLKRASAMTGPESTPASMR